MYSKFISTSAAPRKRRRPAQSCIGCRRRKIKCDRKNPCGQCKSSECIYDIHGVHKKNAQNETAYVTPSRGSSAHARSSTPIASAFILPEQCSTEPAVEIPIPLSHNATHGEEWHPRFGALGGEYALEQVEVGFPRDPTTVDYIYQKRTALTGLWQHTGMRACLSKTRMFGESHWTNSVAQFDKIISFIGNRDDVKNSEMIAQRQEMFRTLNKCKKLVRAHKANRPSLIIRPDYKDTVPPRAVCDKLVERYLQTFETTYRILHIPSFENEYAKYWREPGNVNESFFIKLLLVFAIGAVFYKGPDELHIRSLAQQWVCAAQAWHSVPDKGRLNINGLQIFCLLIVARHESHSAGSDLVWIDTGSLIRTAMQMGYYRDPKIFPKMSILHVEIRRRLWATVLEIAVQTSLDSGMPPLISLDDFDTEPPMNVNDDELDETTQKCSSHPLSVFTQATTQIMLLKSLHTRLDICRLLNDFRSEPTYEDVLRLGGEITRVCRESVALMHAHLKGGPSAFQRNLVDCLLRRFLVAIHRPFASKARQDPRYHFSRKVCLEGALTFLSPEKDEDYEQLLTNGRGICREVISPASMTICAEIIMQLNEEDNTPQALHRSRLSREPLIQSIREMIGLWAKRLGYGDNNVKGHLFLSLALGQIEAMQRGDCIETSLFEAAQTNITLAYEILKARLSADVGTPLSMNQLNQDIMLDDVNEFDFTQDVNFDIINSWLLAGWEANGGI